MNYLHIFVHLIGAVACLVGISAMIAPKKMSGGFGLPRDSSPSLLFVSLGVRDIFMGITIFTLAYLGDWHAVGPVLLAGALVALSDFWIVFRYGSRMFSLVHLCGAVILLACGAAFLAG